MATYRVDALRPRRVSRWATALLLVLALAAGSLLAVRSLAEQHRASRHSACDFLRASAAADRLPPPKDCR